MAENHYLMDTHTAVASAVLRAYQAQTGRYAPKRDRLYGQPYKFGASVLGAVAGQKACDGLDDFACCRALAEPDGHQGTGADSRPSGPADPPHRRL